MRSYKPSVSQRLIWMDQAISEGSAKYNIGGYASLEGTMSLGLFRETIRQIIHSQEVYLTTFREVDFELMCCVAEDRLDYDIRLVDLSEEEAPEASAIEWMQRDFDQAFQVEDNYVYTFLLFKVHPFRYLWYAKIHHLISDGMSFKLLLNQAAEIYNALSGKNDLTPVVYDYSEYALEDNEYYSSGEAAADKEFWLTEFKELPPVLLPDKIPGAQKGPAHSDTLYLSREAKFALEELAQRHKVSVFNILLALILVYFSHTQNRQSIVVGIPVLNRTKKRYRSTSGVFMNLLALNFSMNTTDTFRDLARSIREKMSAALRHQRYPYGKLVKDLPIPMDSLLYDLRLSYEDFSFTSDFGGLKAGATALSNHQETDKLAIYMRDYHDQGFDIRLVYNTEYFDKDSIASFRDSLNHLIGNLSLYEDAPVGTIPLLAEDVRTAILRCSQGPAKDYGRLSFPAMWAHSCLSYPERIAVSCQSASFTYRQIDTLAALLSRTLPATDSGRIALLLPRSEKMIIGLLGSMLAGLAYIPLDPEYPSERIHFILKDADCTVVLTASSLKKEFLLPGIDIVFIEDLLNADTGDTQTRQPLPETYSPSIRTKEAAFTGISSTAYILYTSGTTGKPKGVYISSHSLMDYICTFQEYFRLTEKDVVLQQSSISFDTSVEEIFPVLGKGGRLHIMEDRRDIFQLLQTLGQESVTLLSTSPLVLRQLNTETMPPSLRVMISGGDVLKREQIDLLYNKGIKIYNSYGPTEATVCATYYPLEKLTDVIPIGRPLANREIYILDEQRNPQPFGVDGEIYLGGEGLAKGYINNDILTKENFIPHIFKGAKKLYRTGDTGILRSDGNFLFTGRIDDQLNYRGYRVEAAEVERIILAGTDAQDCIVCIREFRQAPLLVAYVQVGGSSGNLPDDWPSVVKETISCWLPAFMVPDLIVPLMQFPLLISGKVNKEELPAIGPHHFTAAAAVKVMPHNRLEKDLLNIWADILRTDQFGVEDVFFQLGGNSLSVMQLQNHCYRSFEVRLTLHDLFTHVTVRAQAALIESKSKDKYEPIIAAPSGSDYPVSDGQRRLWILSQLEDEGRAYHLSGDWEWQGTMDPVWLEKVLRRLIVRHESLRTVFRENETGELRQVVLNEYEYVFELTQAHMEEESSENVRTYIRTESARTFDLDKGPLFRAGLLYTQPGKCIFYYTMHHIISDGWSMEIIGQDILKNYVLLANGEEIPEKSPLRLQYKDYVCWQQQRLSADAFAGQRTYWMEQLAGELPALSLPTGKTRPPLLTHNGHELSAWLDLELTARLRDCCLSRQTTLFMGLLAGMYSLFCRYSDTEDIIIGTPVMGREHIELEEQIGFYVNTLALRARPQRTDSFSQLLQKIRHTLLGAYSNQLYPFDRLIEDLKIPRDMSRSAIFDVMVILQDQASGRDMDNHFRASPADITDLGPCPVMFDLNIGFSEYPHGLRMMVQFNSDVYDKTTIIRLIEHYRQLLKLLVTSPESAIGRHEYISAAEKYQLLEVFNSTRSDILSDTTILDLLDEQVNETPDDTAILVEDRSMTYRQVKDSSDRLCAWLLKNYTLQADDLVGIQLQRDERMIIAVLAVLKAGAAYVPVDPAYPRERIDYILSDSGCKLLLDDGELEKFRQYDSLPATGIQDPPAHRTRCPDGLAYVIYTSGSTGRPKGVMIGHGNLLAFISWCKKEFDQTLVDTVFGVTSLCFDLSIFEIFYTLCSGRKLRLLPDALSIPQYIGNSGNILLNTVPSVVAALRSDKIDFSNIRILNMAGEPIPAKCIEGLDRSHIQIRNLYGPTEDTTYSTSYHLSDNRTPVPIGKPIDNTEIYIVDSDLRLQPIGVIGEICIAGAGLARGYIGRPELTTARFVPHLFKKEGRMYRTGDLGKWLPEGILDFTGRIDDQVKLRGYRIELGEIDSALRGLNGVADAVVTMRKDTGGEKELAAYFLSPEMLEPHQVRVELCRILPSYMIPRYFMRLTEFPLTPNGKVDKNRLPDPEHSSPDPAKDFIAPRNTTESRLAAIWEQLLNTSHIGTKDDFFARGGHSLKVIRLANRIYQEFHARLALKDLFVYSSLEQQALLIQKVKKTTFPQILPLPPQTGYRLSALQRRLWILSQLEDGNSAYNLPGAYTIDGLLDKDALDYAFRVLLQRHEILRTVFREDMSGEPVQVVLPVEMSGFSIAVIDVRGKERRQEIVREHVRKEFSAGFDMASGPLLRATLCRMQDDAWIFICVLHHIISDEWSMNILIHELFLAYDAYRGKTADVLPPLSIQYKDYAAFRQANLADAGMSEHRHYWIQKFQGELPAAELPADRVRPALKTYNGARKTRTLDAGLTDAVRVLGTRKGSSSFMVLLAAVSVLLHRYGGQKDMIIGIPVAGREHPDLEDQIGLYVNTLALRCQLSGSNSFEEVLAGTGKVLMEAYEHQDYPFDELLNDLNLRQDLSRNPLFDIMVVYRHADNEKVAGRKVDGIRIGEYKDVTQEVSKFDCSFLFEETQDRYKFEIEYNSDIFSGSTISRMMDHFINLLGNLLGDPLASIASGEYLGREERERLLSFNPLPTPYPADKTVVDLFVAQAAATPDNKALICAETILTYRELHEKSDRLARYLQHKYAVARDEIIAISLPRDEWMIISLLGVLKAGAAYLPIDNTYPQERIAYMLTDSRCRIILDGSELSRFLQTENDFRNGELPAVNNPAALAYVIYTSGSTGKPKAVMITHTGVVNLSISQTAALGLTEGMGTLQFASFSFDASCYEIFNTLLSGGFLVLPVQEELLSSHLLSELIDKHTISVAVLPPSYYSSMMKAAEKFRLIVSAGEPLHAEAARQLQLRGVRLINAYGPTESTVCATLTDTPLLADNRVTIGRPIANTFIYILDDNGKLVPEGIAGELYIGGVQLAKGYLHRSELTAQRFIADPFQPHERIYRTGDLAKWLPDGNIEFLGRVDDQLKIRGYRIEAGEIVNALQLQEEVETAAVLARENAAGEKELVAYLTGKPGLRSSELSARLHETLPAYMIPAFFVWLEEIPLTPNGKLDRKRLPDPDVSARQRENAYMPPRNEVEEKLVRIWQELLEKEQVGIKDNFFEAGGHSLKVARLISRIHTTFSVRISLSGIFREPTIEYISGQIIFALHQDKQRSNKEKLVQIDI